MADAVARAIEKPGHLIVEAGTGVGKSFAYLVPAIQATANPKMKVVVSTHTIAFQEQLLSKDIPFLRSVMPRNSRRCWSRAGRITSASDACRWRSNARIRSSSGPKKSTSSPRSGCGRGERRTAAVPTSTSVRFPRSGRPSRVRTATAWAGSAPTIRSASSIEPRRRMRSANVLVVDHGAVRRRPRAAGGRIRACSPTMMSRSSTRRTRSNPWRASTSGMQI